MASFECAIKTLYCSLDEKIVAMIFLLLGLKIVTVSQCVYLNANVRIQFSLWDVGILQCPRNGVSKNFDHCPNLTFNVIYTQQINWLQPEGFKSDIALR